MRWESVLWVAVGLTSPTLAAIGWPRVTGRLPGWAPFVESFGPWVYGIGPAYLALITGAIRARDFGLAGRDPLAWLGGGIICAAWLGLNNRLRRRMGSWPTPVRGALDEPRWALYRAAAALWLGDPQYALLAGLGLAVVEWSLSSVPKLRKDPLRWETMARIASSSVIFALTRSFWLTLVTQAIMLELLRRKRL